MKITILNGSPKKGNTAAMAEAFCESAMAAGHEVEILHVGKMKITAVWAASIVTARAKASASRRTTWRRSCPRIWRAT